LTRCLTGILDDLIVTGENVEQHMKNINYAKLSRNLKKVEHKVQEVQEYYYEA